MYNSYAKDTSFSSEQAATAVFFSRRLEEFLSPFLQKLDQHIDKRLVRSFAGLCQSILRLRSRSSGLLLSELGGYLLGFAHAPAGTKRLSNLLRSKKWSHHLIEEHIQEQAVDHAEDMLQKKQQPLLLWDESVQEKPESIEAEGLCAVRSSKAGRLLRIKRGYYDPPTKKPVHVPGLRWVALLLCGLHHPPVVAKFSWWTSRGKYVTSLSQLRFQLLQGVRDHFADAVLHVFDRGYASSSWIGLLLSKSDRFLLRWPSRYRLLDQEGRLRKAYLFSVGRKPSSSKMLWDSRAKCHLKRSLLWCSCFHPHYPEHKLTLIICRPGKQGRQPWYLLTTEEVDSDKKAWEMVFAYAKRWDIEQCFRFNKSELAMESCRLWFWHNRMKLLHTVTLVYAFLLSLLDEKMAQQKQKLLRLGCHRTGKRCRKTPTPLYRIRLALSNLLNLNLNPETQNSG